MPTICPNCNERIWVLHYEEPAVFSGSASFEDDGDGHIEVNDWDQNDSDSCDDGSTNYFCPECGVLLEPRDLPWKDEDDEEEDEEDEDETEDQNDEESVLENPILRTYPGRNHPTIPSTPARDNVDFCDHCHELTVVTERSKFKGRKIVTIKLCEGCSLESMDL